VGAGRKNVEVGVRGGAILPGGGEVGRGRGGGGGGGHSWLIFVGGEVNKGGGTESGWNGPGNTGYFLCEKGPEAEIASLAKTGVRGCDGGGGGGVHYEDASGG